MRVLIVSRCLPLPLHRGDRLILYHLLRELRALGHRCDVIALCQHPRDDDDVARSAALCERMVPVAEQARWRVQYLWRLARPLPATAAQSWQPRMWRAIEERLTSARYDLVHVFGGIQVYDFRNLLRGLPAIIVPYESHTLWLERSRRQARSALEALRADLALAVTRRYERFMFNGYDRVVVLTGADRDALSRLSPGLNVAVIPNGVLCRPREADRRPAGPPTLVFVGNYDYDPNVRAAVALARDILPSVRGRIPDARAVLVGANPPPAVTSLVNDTVEVTGFVPDVRPYLESAACFVGAIAVGAGMKNKILEAMAEAVPVVTTPIGGEGIDATAGRHLLLGSTVPELADAVIRVLGDPALAARLGEAGRQLVEERYSWREVAARYAALYAEVVAGRRRTAASRVREAQHGAR
jgi:glycosyltransferase involved in cell wall biosynthesis